jgi:hypothetical protein
MGSSHAFYTDSLKALELAQDVEFARFALLVERFREVEVGSRLMATASSAQTPSHTPPHSTYDSNKHERLRDVFIPNPEAACLKNKEFYFAFGQELNVVVVGRKAYEALLAGVFRPEVDVYRSKLTSLGQTLVIIELIETILVTKVHPPQKS